MLEYKLIEKDIEKLKKKRINIIEGKIQPQGKDYILWDDLNQLLTMNKLTTNKKESILKSLWYEFRYSNDIY